MIRKFANICNILEIHILTSLSVPLFRRHNKPGTSSIASCSWFAIPNHCRTLGLSDAWTVPYRYSGSPCPQIFQRQFYCTDRDDLSFSLLCFAILSIVFVPMQRFCYELPPGYPGLSAVLCYSRRSPRHIALMQVWHFPGGSILWRIPG